MNGKEVRRSGLLHVFFVQSQLSFLVSNAIIRSKGLEVSDVLFLLDRAIRVDSEFKAVEVPRGLNKALKREFSGVPASLLQLAGLRSFVRSHCGQKPLHLYVNRMNQLIVEALRRWGRVEALDIYEEGLSAYFRGLIPADGPREQISLAQRLPRVLAGLPGAPVEGRYLDDYNEVLATTTLAFSGFPRRTEVDLGGVISGRTGAVGFEVIDERALLFALPLPYAFQNDEALRKGLVDCIAACVRASPETACFKAHPDRYDNSAFWADVAKQVKALVGVDFRDRMTPDVSLEVLAASRPDVLVVVLISSIAIYAEHYAAPVVSLAPAVFGADFWKVQRLASCSPCCSFFDGEASVDALETFLRGEMPRLGTGIGGHAGLHAAAGEQGPCRSGCAGA